MSDVSGVLAVAHGRRVNDEFDLCILALLSSELLFGKIHDSKRRFEKRGPKEYSGESLILRD
jgi:hypothetical protein